MNRKYIVLSEGYDWLYVGEAENEITLTEYNSLNKYISNNLSSNLINYGFNKLKFINYVGVISVGNLTIEILPKISISKNNTNDRKQLIYMLSKCKKIGVNINELEKSGFDNLSLSEIISKLFTSKLLSELYKGLYFEYISREESLNKIKGKILLTKNIKENSCNKAKAYCKYDEFTENNFLNGVFNKTVKVLLSKVKNRTVINELNIIKNILADIEDIYISKDILNNYKLNRNSSRFNGAFIISKYILNNLSMDNSKGHSDGFSILFEMNYLYEEYIGEMVKGVLLKEKEFNVETQVKGKYLLKNAQSQKQQIALRPDIVVYKGEDAKIIIDTKWKASVYNNIETYSQADIYQMYAYVTRFSSSNKCILLYPKISEGYIHSKFVLQEPFIEKEILIEEVSLENSIETIRDLTRILVKGKIK